MQALQPPGLEKKKGSILVGFLINIHKIMTIEGDKK